MNDTNKASFRSVYPIGKEVTLIPFEQNGKWGYINPLGQVVIQPSFDQVEYFSEGIAGVRISELWGYINDEGKIVIEPQLSFAGPFFKGKAITMKDNIYEVIGANGNVFASIPVYFEIEEPLWAAISGDGMIKISENDRYGYISYDGELVIKPQYKEAGSFSNGLAWVSLEDRKYHFIDRTGKEVITLPEDIIPDSFSEGLAAVRDGYILKSHYIDVEGNRFIDAPLSNPGFFSEGLANILMDSKYGYINKSGNVVIEAQYDSAHPFIRGTALVTIGKRYALINKQGEFVVEPRLLDYVDMLSYLINTDLFRVMVNGKYLFMNRKTGEYVS